MQWYVYMTLKKFNFPTQLFVELRGCFNFAGSLVPLALGYAVYRRSFIPPTHERSKDLGSAQVTGLLMGIG